MIECKMCKKLTINKVYCSEQCQYQGYRKKTAIRVNCNCIYCNKKFEVKEYDISLNRGKYCSKVCSGLHKKETFLGKGNPMFGRKKSEKTKKLLSDSITKKWKTNEYREKIRNGIYKFIEKNKHYPGRSESSNLKRIDTLLKKYGVTHNWKNPIVRKKCEDTCIKKYGKHSWEIMSDALLKTSFTNPEKKISNILYKNNIKFKRNYRIYYDLKNLKCKIYDFLLLEKNILIEADGDYWHANPKFFNNLNEVQIKNSNNDMFKNNLANIIGFKLIRYWESDILDDLFEDKILKEINA